MKRGGGEGVGKLGIRDLFKDSARDANGYLRKKGDGIMLRHGERAHALDRLPQSGQSPHNGSLA